MAVEILKQVGEAEAKADQIRQKANDEAKALIEQAQATAKKMVEDSELKVKTETARLLKEAAEASQMEAKDYLQGIAAQGEVIKTQAKANLADAVEIIVAKVVRASG